MGALVPMTIDGIMITGINQYCSVEADAPQPSQHWTPVQYLLKQMLRFLAPPFRAVCAPACGDSPLERGCCMCVGWVRP